MRAFLVVFESRTQAFRSLFFESLTKLLPSDFQKSAINSVKQPIRKKSKNFRKIIKNHKMTEKPKKIYKISENQKEQLKRQR